MARSRMAFTIVELLVVIALIGALMVILVPALQAARGAARRSQDQSNLRQLGTGLVQFSDRDPGGRFCSGAVDFYRDGCPDTFGWIADLVAANICRPGDLLNPASRMRGHAVYQQVLSSPQDAVATDGGETRGLGMGFCGLGAEWDDAEQKWTKLFKETDPASSQRSDLIARKLAETGYNSNYSASWFLVRGTVKLSQTSSVYRFTNTPSGGARGRGGTLGPLTRRALDNARVGSNLVPLLGDAAPADAGKASLSRAIAKSPENYYLGGSCPDTTAVRYLDTDQPLVASYCLGPAAYNPTESKIELLPGNTDLTNQVRCERGDQLCAAADTSVTDHGWLQDTRAFHAVHSGTCCILMADGSVRDFADQNKDGYLNPGFPVGSSHSKSELDQIGYRPGPTELQAAEFFSGVFLEKVRSGF